MSDTALSVPFLDSGHCDILNCRIQTDGTESLTILDKHTNRMQTSEMKYLRKVLGKTIRDQIRNTNIRNQLKQESIEVLMEKRTLTLYEHAVN